METSKLVKWLLVIGIILDLAISGVLLYQQQQINTNSAKNDCWSSTLDYAVQKMPHTQQGKAILTAKAIQCSHIK